MLTVNCYFYKISFNTENPSNITMKIISNKICIIAPSLQMGGIERELTILANFFVDKGYEVYYITLLNLEPFFYSMIGLSL